MTTDVVNTIVASDEGNVNNLGDLALHIGAGAKVFQYRSNSAMGKFETIGKAETLELARLACRLEYESL